MPLGSSYKKWDNLELSDDSDIEVHPNVDKRSFIRWKQRDVHEKRDERKKKIAFLHSEIALNDTLYPRVEAILGSTRSDGRAFFTRTMSQLEATKDKPDAQRPPESKDGPSYDDMIWNLMSQVANEAKDKAAGDNDELEKRLIASLEEHLSSLGKRTQDCHKEIKQLEDEAKDKITSEGIHDAFSISHVSKNPATAQIVDPVKPAPAAPSKKQEIEVLNQPPATSGNESDDSSSGAEESLPALTPAAYTFTRLPIDNWEMSFKCISANPILLNEANGDAIFVEAFEAGMRGDMKYAYACVHQALTLQYCRKLGRDGVALFFKRMATNPQALKVFKDDVTSTFERVGSRSTEMAKERKESGVDDAGQRETIQLVAADSGTTIGFEVPEGPPPENIKLEGEGTEHLDVEQVRAFLQKQWDIYESFPKNFKKALKSKNLEEVNRILGKMSVEQGEETVKLLDEGGILCFSQKGIVDQTGKAEAEAEAEAAALAEEENRKAAEEIIEKLAEEEK